MARQKAKKADEKPPKFRPASSPENRENQLASLAYDLAEERLRNGTASAQEIVYFLRIGSIREKKELEMMGKKNELKTEALQSAKKVEELYSNAIKAFAAYRGGSQEEYDEEELY